MLQRAASNAYSWWWASHIRTKQSKWLEQNLQDLEEKVATVLKLIEEDGDSFAKRAEMYYKKRPELINFVEETYRAYRALAERYDHISKELQNANNTIASVFPDQVQFSMDDDDDDGTPRYAKRPPPIELPKANIPKVPNAPAKDLKGLITTATKKLQPKNNKKIKYKASYPKVPKSGLDKPEAMAEIDKLQKTILMLQTEKEFVKSSYEGGLAKYFDIEKQIKELQEKIVKLQDEFGEGMVIDDDDARSLMAAAALKSCEQALAQLVEKQERSIEEAKSEELRIKETREKFESLKSELLHDQGSQENPGPNNEPTKLVERPDRVARSEAQEEELDLLREKIRAHFEVGANASLTVSELAEKIDELVGKVVSLETAVSSQTALIHRLSFETDDLQAQIRTLEDDKATLTDGKNDLREKLRAMEHRLNGVQDLNETIDDQNSNLKTHFTEAQCNLEHLSDKMQDVKLDEELKVASISRKEESSVNEVKSEKAIKETVDTLIPDIDIKETQVLKKDDGLEASGSLPEEEKYRIEKVRTPKEVQEQEKKLIPPDTIKKEANVKSEEDEKDAKKHNVTSSDRSQGDVSPSPASTSSESHVDKKVSSPKLGSILGISLEQEEEPDWKQMFSNGLEEREKTLLVEYTAVLRNYKEMKKKLSEAEAKNQDNEFETTVQLRELKSVNAMKDEEIRLLRERLELMQTGFDAQSFKDSNNQQNIETDKGSEKPTTPEPSTAQMIEREVSIRYIVRDEPESTSALELKFRSSIDERLEENLDFWLRFSTVFGQIQKFDTEVQDLQADLGKLEDKQKKQDGSSSLKYSLKSDARPLYNHLKEIHTELSLWLEKSTLLKEELKSRFESLCEIQEEITKALKESAEDEDFKFTSFQAAKFQGEVLNMKQENNKVADELQAGLDHITTLQLEVERTLAKLNDKFSLGSKNRSNIQLQHSESRSRVPLRSFIFGVKEKKQKPSIFACVHPALQKKYNGLRSKTS